MPTELPEGIVLPCNHPREDTRDAFISKTYKSIDELPQVGSLHGPQFSYSGKINAYFILSITLKVVRMTIFHPIGVVFNFQSFLVLVPFSRNSVYRSGGGFVV